MKNEFISILKSKGFKVTNQRLLVLEVLAEHADRHLTAEEIYDLVRAQNPDIGLATVYRTIQLLLELKLVDKIHMDDGFVRYEIGQIDESDEKHHHHHLVCLDCGRIESFADDLLEVLEKKIMDTADFSVVNHEVKFYGYCKACRQKRK